jgi:hypothetical protein
MTGRTDEKQTAKRRIAAPAAGTASPAGTAGAGAPAGARDTARRGGGERGCTDSQHQ